MLTPNMKIRSRRNTAQKNACITNLRQINGVKEQWALEKRKTSGAATVDSEVDQYISGGRPNCPGGGTYTYGAIDTAPTCSVPEHAL